MHDDLISAVDADLANTIRTLEDLVRIPSVSAPGFDGEQVRRSAAASVALLESSGAPDVRLLELDGAPPAVFTEVSGPPGAPTVLLYAHHDVQPPGPESEWTTPPFDPVQRGGRLYGRGVADDKSGVAMHAAVLRAFAGSPPVTVKVFLEGEEEVGSTHLPDFLDRHASLLAADVIVIADSGNLETGVPALTTSLRGLVDCIVEVRTSRAAVHSGGFGGAAPDALTVLSRMLATLHDDDGEVAVAGLVGVEHDVDIPEAMFRRLCGLQDGVELIGSGSIAGRLWTKPAIAVLAIDAPPVAEAINQLVPVARAKVSLRLAPGDVPPRARDALIAHLRASVPWGADVTITPGALGDPIELDPEGPAYDAFRAGLSIGYGTDTVEIGQGGSIPFVAAFRDRYPKASILLTGAGDMECAAHGPDESVDLGDLRASIIGEAVALRLLAAAG